MKSEKAKEFIDGLMDRIRISMFDEHDRQLAKVEIGDHAKEQLRLAMTLVVELAEQEAEERMQTKAAEAYCRDCCCTVVGKCGIGLENCEALRDFIQKLNENEDD